MTKETANKLLDEACNIIFRVEECLSDDSDDLIRKQGYRARVEIGKLQNMMVMANNEDIGIRDYK